MIPFPKKKYNIIYADPPWNVWAGCTFFKEKKYKIAKNRLRKKLTYPTMDIEDIKNLPVKDLSNKDSKLFIWTINKYLPQTFDVINSWGFKYSTCLTWCKKPMGLGLGGTFSGTTEFLMFAHKGKVNAKKRIDTTWFLEKRGIHSKKPNKFINLIDDLFDGDKIELFARQKVEGWDSWGNEV
jgi:site-specific DNA-methyltransferase (adenine-specific)